MTTLHCRGAGGTLEETPKRKLAPPSRLRKITASLAFLAFEHMNAKLFINYRREDTAPYAGRLYDRLSAHFGDEQVFIDIDQIEPGEDFVEAIGEGRPPVVSLQEALKTNLVMDAAYESARTGCEVKLS